MLVTMRKMFYLKLNNDGFLSLLDLSIAKCKHDLADAFNSKWLTVHHHNQFKWEGQSYNTLWSNPVCVNKIMNHCIISECAFIYTKTDIRTEHYEHKTLKLYKIEIETNTKRSNILSCAYEDWKTRWDLSCVGIIFDLLHAFCHPTDSLLVLLLLLASKRPFGAFVKISPL